MCISDQCTKSREKLSWTSLGINRVHRGSRKGWRFSSLGEEIGLQIDFCHRRRSSAVYGLFGFE